jgi:hypothetical protein
MVTIMVVYYAKFGLFLLLEKYVGPKFPCLIAFYVNIFFTIRHLPFLERDISTVIEITGFDYLDQNI